MATTEIFRYLLFTCEAIACIAAFTHWRRFAVSPLRLMPWYLLIISVSEVVSYFTAKQGIVTYNQVISLYLVPLEFLFMFWLITRHLHKQTRNVFLVVLVIIYGLSVMAEEFYFTHQKNVFQSFSYCAGAILLLLAVIAFLLHFSSTNQVLVFKSKAVFWIALGLILFYLSTFPYYAFFNYWWNEHTAFAYKYFYAHMVANCSMYLIFSYSFIKCK